MKRKFCYLFLPLLALLVVGCSNNTEDPDVEEPTITEEDPPVDDDPGDENNDNQPSEPDEPLTFDAETLLTKLGTSFATKGVLEYTVEGLYWDDYDGTTTIDTQSVVTDSSYFLDLSENGVTTVSYYYVRTEEGKVAEYFYDNHAKLQLEEVDTEETFDSLYYNPFASYPLEGVTYDEDTNTATLSLESGDLNQFNNLVTTMALNVDSDLVITLDENFNPVSYSYDLEGSTDYLYMYTYTVKGEFVDASEVNVPTYEEELTPTDAHNPLTNLFSALSDFNFSLSITEQDAEGYDVASTYDVFVTNQSALVYSDEHYEGYFIDGDEYVAVSSTYYGDNNYQLMASAEGKQSGTIQDALGVDLDFDFSAALFNVSEDGNTYTLVYGDRYLEHILLGAFLGDVENRVLGAVNTATYPLTITNNTDGTWTLSYTYSYYNYGYYYYNLDILIYDICDTTVPFDAYSEYHTPLNWYELIGSLISYTTAYQTLYGYDNSYSHPFDVIPFPSNSEQYSWVVYSYTSSYNIRANVVSENYTSRMLLEDLNSRLRVDEEFTLTDSSDTEYIYQHSSGITIDIDAYSSSYFMIRVSTTSVVEFSDNLRNLTDDQISSIFGTSRANAKTIVPTLNMAAYEHYDDESQTRYYYTGESWSFEASDTSVTATWTGQPNETYATVFLFAIRDKLTGEGWVEDLEDDNLLTKTFSFDGENDKTYKIELSYSTLEAGWYTYYYPQFTISLQ